MTAELPTGPELPNGRRRVAVVLAAIGLVIAIGVIAVSIQPRTASESDDDAPSSSESASPQPSESPIPSSSSTVVPIDPDPAVDVPGGVVVDSVPITEVAQFGGGVTARVVAFDAIEASGNLVGEISGPAIQVQLELTNASQFPVDTRGAVVTFDYSPDRTPAAPFDSLSTPLPESIAPTTAAIGTFVFSVPAGNRSVYALSVSYGRESSYVVFQPA